MIDRDDDFQDEELEEEDDSEVGVRISDSVPVGPKIDDEAGAILDRIADARVRAQHSAVMNDTIRRAFGKGGPHR